MRPIPATRIGDAHGLLRAIEKRGRLRTDEFVTEFSLAELFDPGLENALGRMRHFLSYARAAGLVKEDRGVVELTEIGRRYIRTGDPSAPYDVSPAQAEWLRRQLRERHMTDSIYHGLAIGLSLLASCPPGVRIATLDFGRSMAYLGRAGWDNENTLLIQGERHLILLADMEVIYADRSLTPAGEELRAELALPVHVGLPDLAAQLNEGGAEGVRAAAAAEWPEPAPEPEPEPARPLPAAEPEPLEVDDSDSGGYETVGGFGAVPESRPPPPGRPPVVPRAAQPPGGGDKSGADTPTVITPSHSVAPPDPSARHEGPPPPEAEDWGAAEPPPAAAIWPGGPSPRSAATSDAPPEAEPVTSVPPPAEALPTPAAPPAHEPEPPGGGPARPDEPWPEPAPPPAKVDWPSAAAGQVASPPTPPGEPPSGAIAPPQASAARAAPELPAPSPAAQVAPGWAPPPPPAGAAVPDRAPREAPAQEFVGGWAIRAAAEDAGLRLPDSVYANVGAALAGGKHLILTGAPGAGKTTLALAIARAAAQAGHASGAMMVAAADGWADHDLLIDAASSGRWVIVDELERTQPDRALGPLSAFLAGLSIQRSATEESAPANGWRLVATWGDGPPRGSAAVLRRFAVIEVLAPDDGQLHAAIERAARGDVTAARAAERLLPARELAPLGAGVFLDAARHGAARQAARATDEDVLVRELFAAYVRPLLGSLDDARERRVAALWA